MKFFAIATAFALVLATTVAGKAIGTAENPKQPSTQQPGTQQKGNSQQTNPQQTCSNPSNCPCAAGQTQFCGNEAVNPACLNGHLFVCDGNTGKACDKGTDGSCGN